MVAARLVALLATVASAQYAITDMLADQPKGASEGGSQTGPQIQPIHHPHVTHGGAPDTTHAITPMAGNPMMNLLTGIAGPLAGAGTSLPSVSTAGEHSDPFSGQALGQEGAAIVSGLIEHFMHKVHFQPHERACLERNMAQLTGDVMGTIGDAVTAIKALVAGQGTIAKGSSGNVISGGMDAVMKIISLVTLSTQLLKTCVHGDALIFLNTTAQHLINGTYLKHTILVNGVDIAHSLSDSILAFEAHNYHRFGSDIGVALRKILLSTNNKVVMLPEGMPEEKIIQKATDGLFRGFFTRGSSLEITDGAHPDIDIVVNLHRCIAGNSPFFKSLWLSAWDLIAQLSANSQQHDFGFGAKQGQPKWAGEIMVAMMQFPMALSKCGVSSNIQTMFTEAIQSLGQLHVQFHFPQDRFRAENDQFRAEDATGKMAKAVEAWTNWDFESFGYELGELFRELIMLAFPEKYSVDDTGRLQQYVQMDAQDSGKTSNSVPAATVIIGGGAGFMMLAFAAIRTRRSTAFARRAEDRMAFTDMEDGDGAETLE
jgi:hypothetical protein